jgi:Na+-driven multidrug efflux pump
MEDDELTNQVESITGKKIKKNNKVQKEHYYIKDIKIYLIITFIVFLFLFGIKPQFLYVLKKNKKVFSYYRTIKYTVIISIIIILFHYIYMNYFLDRWKFFPI